MPEKERRNGKPTGKVRAKWRDAAGQDASKTFDTWRAAKAHEDAMREAVRHGTYIDRATADTPFAIVAEDWFAIHCETGIRAESMKSYATAMRRDGGIIDKWGTTPVGKLNGYALNAWLTGLGRKFSRSYTQTHRDVLCMIFDYAKDASMVPAHPLAERKKRGVGREPAEVLIPTPAEVLLAYSQPELPDHLGLAWRLMAECSLRPGEVLGLMWPRDVDFRNRFLHVRGQLDREGNLDAKPKSTRSKRKMPLTDELLDAINAHVAAGYGPSVDGTLFRDEYGRKCRDHVLQAHSRKAWVAAGLGQFSARALRRYWSQRLGLAGLPDSVIDAAMGHAPQNLRSAHYFTLTDEHYGQIRAALPSLTFVPAPHLRRTEGSASL